MPYLLELALFGLRKMLIPALAGVSGYLAATYPAQMQAVCSAVL